MRPAHTSKCTEFSSLGTSPFIIQGGATQAQTCPDLELGQGWVCLRLLRLLASVWGRGPQLLSQVLSP